MEVGNYLANQKNDVTIIGMESAPLWVFSRLRGSSFDANWATRERVMGAQVGQVFQRLAASAGAKFKMSASVEKATPSGKALSPSHVI